MCRRLSFFDFAPSQICAVTTAGFDYKGRGGLDLRSPETPDAAPP
jgi:hypothetical protein